MRWLILLQADCTLCMEMAGRDVLDKLGDPQLLMMLLQGQWKFTKGGA